MHPLDNTTRFFAVVGAPYIPERHFGDCCEEAPKQSFSASNLEREYPRSAQEPGLGGRSPAVSDDSFTPQKV